MQKISIEYITIFLCVQKCDVMKNYFKKYINLLNYDCFIYDYINKINDKKIIIN